MEDILKSNNIIIEEEEIFNKIYRAKKIYLANGTVSSEFIKRIFYDDNYYNQVKKFFEKGLNDLQIVFLENSHIKGQITYSKSEILLAMEVFVKENHIKDEMLLKRLNTLRDLISSNKLEDRYNNKTLEIDIDNIHYVIKIKDILDMLNKSNYEFRDICDNEYEEKIENMPKEHFIYAIKVFLQKERILDNYLVSNAFSANARDIFKNYLDIEAINELTKIEDELYKQVTLDKELEQAVLSGMPKEFTTLEKAIYVYIMLCKILTYDEEFRALNQEGEALKKHQDYHLVEKINPRNNHVVCYENNLIYTKFLSMIGNITFKSEYRTSSDESGYGNGHVNLKMRIGKFLIRADSIENVLHGDMPKAKRNEQLSGMKVINRNNNTQEEFYEAFEKVYRFIIEREDKVLYQGESFDDLLTLYQHKTNNYTRVDLKKKVDILIDKINDSCFIGVDAFSYILYLRNIIFNSEERRYKVKINVVTNNNPINKDMLAMLSAVIMINEHGLDNKECTHYYLFTPRQELLPISFDELKSLFDNNTLCYLERDENVIDGIPKRSKDK